MFLFQVGLYLGLYLFCGLVHIFIYSIVFILVRYILCGLAHVLPCYIIYIVLVTSVKSLYKLITQVYNGNLKLSGHSSADRAILITGATSGIGLALSKYFNAQGYRIIAGYSTRDEVGYDELLLLNQLKGGKSIFLVHVDVRLQHSIKESYEKVREILTENRLRLHALINNAGIAQFYPAHWSRRRDIVAMAETNLIGPMLMVRQYMPLLIKSSPGSRIVNVGSIIGRAPVPISAVYGATKAGLAMFSNSLAFDISKHNVKVVTIYLGHAVHHTSIANKAASGAIVTFDELWPEEQALYEIDFRTYKRDSKACEGLLLIKDFANSGASKAVDVTAPRWSSTARLWVLKGLEVALGAVKRRAKLEKSCFMESFDNAINMRNPPKEMYAGSRFYAIFTSSFLDTLGRDVVRILSSLCSSLPLGDFFEETTG